MIKRSIFKSTTKDRCDELFAKIITSAGYCCKCGRRDLLTTAHFVARRYSATRCDLRNACCLCMPCHRKLTDNPNLHDEFVYSLIGPLYDELKTKAQAVTKVNWEQVYPDLKKVLANNNRNDL